jgi:hypothetical protein
MSIKIFNRNYKFRQLLPLILGLISIFSSCSKKTSPCGDPAPTIIQIGLVDRNDSLLIGKMYDPDSIKFCVGEKRIFVGFYKGYMSINYNGFEVYNNMNCFLYLSKTDVDTLTFKVLRYDSECWNYYNEFDGLTYNSKLISPLSVDKSVFKIIKE